MKLYDGAVLLIIGSVLIGPIAPRSTFEPVKCDRPSEMVSGKQCHYDTFRSYETTAQTCARAIKKIGAIKRIPNSSRPWDEDMDGWHKSGRRVLCFPAPTGLKR